jgi:hypothetical protein
MIIGLTGSFPFYFEDWIIDEMHETSEIADNEDEEDELNDEEESFFPFLQFFF